MCEFLAVYLLYELDIHSSVSIFLHAHWVFCSIGNVYVRYHNKARCRHRPDLSLAVGDDSGGAGEGATLTAISYLRVAVARR